MDVNDCSRCYEISFRKKGDDLRQVKCNKAIIKQLGEDLSAIVGWLSNPLALIPVGLQILRLQVGPLLGLSETRRPGSGETSSKGFTYYWSGMSNGHHVKGVAIGISSRL